MKKRTLKVIILFLVLFVGSCLYGYLLVGETITFGYILSMYIVGVLIYFSITFLEGITRKRWDD